MNPAFNISPGNIIAGETNLYCEVSEEGFRYVLQDDKQKKIAGLHAYGVITANDERDPAIRLKKLFDEQQLLTNSFKKIVVSYSFKECILIPAMYYNVNHNVENMNTVFGDLEEGIILSDHLPEKNLHVVYRIPADIHRAVIYQFPLANFVHQYTITVKQLPQTGITLQVIFYQHKIIAALIIENRLQIIQTFMYVTAKDIVYHMLNILQQFQVKEVDVELSGSIEIDSPLCKEIYTYLQNIKFACLPKGLLYIEEIKQFPQHFFSNLFSIALCV